MPEPGAGPHEPRSGRSRGTRAKRLPPAKPRHRAGEPSASTAPEHGQRIRDQAGNARNAESGSPLWPSGRRPPNRLGLVAPAVVGQHALPPGIYAPWPFLIVITRAMFARLPGPRNALLEHSPAGVLAPSRVTPTKPVSLVTHGGWANAGTRSSASPQQPSVSPDLLRVSPAANAARAPGFWRRHGRGGVAATARVGGPGGSSGWARLATAAR